MQKREPAIEYWLLEQEERRLRREYCITAPNGHHDVWKFGLGDYTAEELDGVVEREPDTRGYPWAEVEDFANEEALDYETGDEHFDRIIGNEVADTDEEDDIFSLRSSEDTVESVDFDGGPLTIGVVEILIATAVSRIPVEGDVVMQEDEPDLGPRTLGCRKAVCREYGGYRKDGLGDGAIERRSKALRSTIAQDQRRWPEVFHSLRANRIG